MTLAKLPLLFHALLETGAALSFILKPEQQQLPGASEEARLILRSYGGLLLSSAVLCASFFFRPGYDSASRLVAASMAVYHPFPVARAYVRLRRGPPKHAQVLGGPVVHMLVHVVALVGLLLSAVYGGE